MCYQQQPVYLENDDSICNTFPLPESQFILVMYMTGILQANGSKQAPSGKIQDLNHQCQSIN